MPWIAPLIVAAALLAAAAPAGAEVRDLHVRAGGALRSYRLFEPSRAPVATVVMFHGGGMDGAEQAALSGFDAVGEGRRWAVAYPDGVRGHWNSGSCCGGRERGDDVRFFDALLRDLARRGLPARRVTVAGFSDGGFFAYRLACQRTGRLSAVVAVATTMVFRPCRPSRPVPVTAISMEHDRVLPRAAAYGAAPAAAVSRFWRRANGCRHVSRGETAAWRVQRGRRCDAAFASYVVKGEGHGWPSVATQLAIAP